MNSTALPTPEELLPHAAPMVFLDTLLRVDDSSCACAVRIRPDQPFVASGAMPSLVGVEMIAQTVGVHVGHSSHVDGEPIRVGYLVGVREAEFAVDDFPVGSDLVVAVSRVLGGGGLATYAGSVSCDGAVWVKGTVNVYREEA